MRDYALCFNRFAINEEAIDHEPKEAQTVGGTHLHATRCRHLRQIERHSSAAMLANACPNGTRWVALRL